MEQGSERRKVREAALETCLFSMGALIIVVAISRYGINEDIDSAFARAVRTGELLQGQLGWILTSYITVLVAFYIVIIGGQLWGSRHETRRVKRTLGVVAELMVASLAPILAFLVAYWVSEPIGWAIFLAALPVTLIVVFLAVQLGSFIVFDPEALYKFAEEKVARVGRLLPALKRRPREPAWLIYIANAGVLAVLATVLDWPAGSVGRWCTAAGGYFVVSLIIAVSIMLPNCERLTSGRSQWGFGLWLVPALTALLFVALAAVLIFDNWGEAASARRGAAFVMSLVCLMVSGTLTEKAPLRLFHWSLRGAAFGLAASLLASNRRAGRRDMRELDGLKPRGFYQKLDARFEGGAKNFHA